MRRAARMKLSDLSRSASGRQNVPLTYTSGLKIFAENDTFLRHELDKENLSDLLCARGTCLVVWRVTFCKYAKSAVIFPVEGDGENGWFIDYDCWSVSDSA